MSHPQVEFVGVQHSAQVLSRAGRSDQRERLAAAEDPARDQQMPQVDVVVRVVVRNEEVIDRFREPGFNETPRDAVPAVDQKRPPAHRDVLARTGPLRIRRGLPVPNRVNRISRLLATRGRHAPALAGRVLRDSPIPM